MAFGELLQTFGFPLIAAVVAAYRECSPAWMRNGRAASLPANAAEPGTVGTNSGRLVRSQTLSPLRHVSDRGANRVQLYTRTIRRPDPRSCSVHAGASALAASGGEILWHQRPPAVCRAMAPA